MRASAIPLLVLLIAANAQAQPESLPSAEILQFIRTTQEAYVFPYKFRSNHPKRDDKYLRLLDKSAVDALKRLLGNRSNWYDGMLTVAEPVGLPSAGVLLRSNGDELVLFFDPSTMTAKFRGRFYYGALEHKPIEQLERWKARYARLELQGK
jgi:hypothetical protein